MRHAQISYSSSYVILCFVLFFLFFFFYKGKLKSFKLVNNDEIKIHNNLYQFFESII